MNRKKTKLMALALTMIMVIIILSFSVSAENAMVCGESYEVSLTDENKNVSYSFTPQSSGAYTLTIVAEQKHHNARISLLDSNGRLLAKTTAIGEYCGDILPYYNMVAGRTYYYQIAVCLDYLDPNVNCTISLSQNNNELKAFSFDAYSYKESGNMYSLQSYSDMHLVYYYNNATGRTLSESCRKYIISDIGNIIYSGDTNYSLTADGGYGSSFNYIERYNEFSFTPTESGTYTFTLTSAELVWAEMLNIDYDLMAADENKNTIILTCRNLLAGETYYYDIGLMETGESNYTIGIEKDNSYVEEFTIVGKYTIKDNYLYGVKEDATETVYFFPISDSVQLEIGCTGIFTISSENIIVGFRDDTTETTSGVCYFHELYSWSDANGNTGVGCDIWESWTNSHITYIDIADNAELFGYTYSGTYTDAFAEIVNAQSGDLCAYTITDGKLKSLDTIIVSERCNDIHYNNGFENVDFTVTEDTAYFNFTALEEGMLFQNDEIIFQGGNTYSFDVYLDDNTGEAIAICVQSFKEFDENSYKIGYFLAEEADCSDRIFFNGESCIKMYLPSTVNRLQDKNSGWNETVEYAIFNHTFLLNGNSVTNLNTLANYNGLVSYQLDEYGLVTKIDTLSLVGSEDVYRYSQGSFSNNNNSFELSPDTKALFICIKDGYISKWNSYFDENSFDDNKKYAISIYKDSNDNNVLWVTDEGEDLITIDGSAMIIPQLEKIKVDINVNSSLSNYNTGKGYAAMYHNGKLEQLQSFNIDLDTNNVSVLFDYAGTQESFRTNYEIKTFGWDNNLMPIATSISYSVWDSTLWEAENPIELAQDTVVYIDSYDSHYIADITIDGYEWHAIAGRRIFDDYAGQTISGFWDMGLSNSLDIITFLYHYPSDDDWGEYHTIKFPESDTRLAGSFMLENDKNVYVLNTGVEMPRIGYEYQVEYIDYDDFRLVTKIY